MAKQRRCHRADLIEDSNWAVMESARLWLEVWVKRSHLGSDSPFRAFRAGSEEVAAWRGKPSAVLPRAGKGSARASVSAFGTADGDRDPITRLACDDHREKQNTRLWRAGCL